MPESLPAGTVVIEPPPLEPTDYDARVVSEEDKAA